MTDREPLLRKVDAVTVRVPSIDEGLAFYRDRLEHALRWRNDAIGQAGLALPDSDTELVLTTSQSYEPNWLVESVDAAVERFITSGGEVVVPPTSLPVGRLAVVRDPFANVLVLLDLSTGTYETDPTGNVTGIRTAEHD